MLDLKFIREFQQSFDKVMVARGVTINSSLLLELDEKLRKQMFQLQELQNKRNDIAKQIGVSKQKGEDVTVLLTSADEIKAQLPQLEEAIKIQDNELNEILIGIPNILDEGVPFGKDENDNKVLRKWSEPKKFDFTPKEHDELGINLGMMDFEQTAKISGSRFVTLNGVLARLERALKNFMLDVHTTNFGYQEISHPALVKQNAMFGTGQIPKFIGDFFQTKDDFYLIPTSEVFLTNLAADKIIPQESLPIRYVAYSSCFRSEAGSAGKDTKGMIRVHQFPKVELVSITTEQDSIAEHERMTNAAEEILKRLELPYRVVLLCSGDTGFHAKKTYDLEVWLPGQNKYREISSCSNCGDFQARRMMARYKKYQDKKNYYVHTLNGSGLAIGRAMVAIIENYQNADGSIAIPKALQPYMNGLTEIQRG
jgi:seryl-tRNA synthetase